LRFFLSLFLQVSYNNKTHKYTTGYAVNVILVP